jgi:hypothetical protein
MGPLLGMWQLTSLTGTGLVDTSNLDQGYVYFAIFDGRPAVTGIHGLVGGCSEFFDAVSLKQGTVQSEEQLPQASVSCKTNVPAIVSLGRALTGAGVGYSTTGNELVLTLADGTAMNFKKASTR